MKFSYRHKSRGILYVLTERLCPWQMHNQFRRIDLWGFEKIPYDQPVLIAANHPTAFLDPVLLGVYGDPPVYFMTRGDIFQNPRARRILEMYNMFPVNRLRDGFKGADRLDQTNEYVFDRLLERQALLIFTEGQHHADKRVLTMQKGVARLAFGAYERFKQDDLQVLPVGFSYWYTDRPRDVVSILVGEPLYVKDYWEEYLEKPAHAANRLLRDIRTQLIELSYHIEDENDDELVEYLLALHRAEHPLGVFPVLHRSRALFDGEKNIIEQVATMEADDKADLRERVKKYRKSLKKAGLSDEGLLHPEWSGPVVWIVLFLTFPLFLLGWVLRKPVVSFAHFFIRKKVKKKEFRSSVYYGIEFFGGMLWYLLLFLIALISQKPVWIALALLGPLAHTFSIFYGESGTRALASLRARFHAQKAALLEERSRL